MKRLSTLLARMALVLMLVGPVMAYDAPQATEQAKAAAKPATVLIKNAFINL